jgi:hypothetical protein
VWLLARFHGDATSALPLSLLWLGILVWLLSVNVRILRSALEWPIYGCVSLVVLQSLAELQVFRVFPAAPGSAAGE